MENESPTISPSLTAISQTDEPAVVVYPKLFPAQLVDNGEPRSIDEKSESYL